MTNVNDKAYAVTDYLRMIVNSWTWARLNHDKRNGFLSAIDWAQEQGVLTGTYKHRWMICEAIYMATLNGAGYKPTGWRE